MAIVVWHLGKISVEQSLGKLMGVQHLHSLGKDPVGIVADVVVHEEDKSHLKGRDQEHKGQGEMLFQSGRARSNALPEEEEQYQKPQGACKGGPAGDGKNQGVAA